MAQFKILRNSITRITQSFIEIKTLTSELLGLGLHAAVETLEVIGLLVIQYFNRWIIYKNGLNRRWLLHTPLII